MFIHAVACVRSSFLLKAEWYFIVCIYRTLFIHSGNISLNAFIFFIYIHMGFVYGKNVWSYSFPSCTAAAAKSLQSCLTLCNPIDSSPLGSPVPGVLQASTLEWVAISFSSAWKLKVKVKSLSHVWLFTTPWTAAYQAPPSLGFSRQEYWSGMPSPSLPLVLIPAY